MCEACCGPGPTRRQVIAQLAAGAAVLAAAPLVGGRRVSAAPSVAPVAVAPDLAVMPRSAWDRGDGATGPLVPEDVRFLLVHHTAGPNEYGPDQVPDLIHDAYRFHTSAEKGWPDLTYNFMIDKFGGVWEGRSGSLDGPVMADATGGSQGFAQLVCLLGDFTAVMPTPEAIDALVRTLAWMARRHGVDTTPGATVEFESRGSNRWPAGTLVTAATISGHRDMSSTACPGDTFYPVVHDLLPTMVDEHLRAGAPASTTTSSTTTSTTSTTSTSTSSSTTTTSTTTTTSPPRRSTTSTTTDAPSTSSSSTGAPVSPATTRDAVVEPARRADDDGDDALSTGRIALGAAGFAGALGLIAVRARQSRSGTASGSSGET